MELYVTGTIVNNRIPRELRIIMTSAHFKDMPRGAYEKHVYQYNDDQGRQRKYGLVCWKDRDIVYCLTSEANTNDIGGCHRRSQVGIICIERPKVVEQYNQFLGGVDLADMRRLHCNSTIMGQNR
jgi:Transposase IS4